MCEQYGFGPEILNVIWTEWWSSAQGAAETRAL